MGLLLFETTQVIPLPPNVSRLHVCVYVRARMHSPLCACVRETWYYLCGSLV